MRIRYILAGIFFSASVYLSAQSELRPVFDKSLLDIQPIEQPVFQFEQTPFYIDKLKLKSDFDLFEPYIRQGMQVVDFQKVPLNSRYSSRQVFLIKHPSGKTFQVINRMPGAPFSQMNTPVSGSGTAVSFDLCKLVYYAFHPHAKECQKQTVLKRIQICNHVYAQ